MNTYTALFLLILLYIAGACLLWLWTIHNLITRVVYKQLPDDKIIDRSNLKQSTDGNFKFDENSRKFS